MNAYATRRIPEPGIELLRRSLVEVEVSPHDRALVAALQSRRIAGAGLDVYENEPRLPPGLAELTNAVLTPHVGSATIETRTRMAVLAAENLLDVLEGCRPRAILNPEVLQK